MSRIIDAFLKNVPLSTFRGKPSESAQDWLSEIDEYFDFVNATPAQRVQGARLLLRDNARRWLKNFTPGEDPTTNWNLFKQALLARFDSPNSKYFARSKLYELKQRGSVTKYISEFEDLRSKIDDLGQAEAIQAFLNGLKPKLQEHFAGNPLLRTDLSMIMQIAESLDNVQHRHHVPILQMPQTQRTPVYKDPNAMEIDAISRQKPVGKNINAMSQKQIDMTNRTCFYCHQPNHQARQCPNKAKSQSGKAQSH